MITVPSTEVLLVVAAILLVLMSVQWFLGGMSRRQLGDQTPETQRRSSARVPFHRAA